MKPATLLRVIGIVLGVLAALSLARSGLGIRFREEFLPLIELIEHRVADFVQPMEVLLVIPIVDWLNAHGLTFELHKHWRQVFVLLWLFNSSYSGAFAPVETSLLNKVRRSEFWSNVTFIGLTWTSAAIIAFFAGISAGLVPLNDSAVFWRPIIAFFLFISVRAFLAAVFQDKSHARPGVISLLLTITLLAMQFAPVELTSNQSSHLWWAIAAYFLYSAALVFRPGAVGRSSGLSTILLTVLAAVGACVALALGLIDLPVWFSPEDSPSPGLVNLALFVTALAAIDLVSAAYWSRQGQSEFLDRWLSSPKAKSSLRILYVVGASFLLIWWAKY